MTQIILEIPDKLAKRLSREAEILKISENARIVKLLEENIAPNELLNPKLIENGLPKLVNLIKKIPNVDFVSHSELSETKWWVKFSFNIDAPNAWNIVQELGFVLNYISISERLPTVFKPVSPPPYLNGGPKDFLSWTIEPIFPLVNPKDIADILEERLPNPIDSLEVWKEISEDD